MASVLNVHCFYNIKFENVWILLSMTIVVPVTLQLNRMLNTHERCLSEREVGCVRQTGASTRNQLYSMQESESNSDQCYLLLRLWSTGSFHLGLAKLFRLFREDRFFG
jgi:hypothetical protein